MVENIYTMIYIISALATIVFLFFLFQQKSKTKASNALILVIFLGFVWTVIEIIAPQDFISAEAHFVFWKLAFFVSSIMTLSLFRFILVFYNIYEKIRFFIKVLIVLVYLLFFYITVIKDFIVAGIISNSKMWEVGYLEGKYFALATIIIASPMFIGFFISLYKYLKTKINKKKYLIVTLALFFPTVVGLATNLFFPLFNIDFPRMANLSSVIMIAFLFYVIYEMEAFSKNVKRYSIKLRLIVVIVFITSIASLSGFFIFYNDSLEKIKNEFNNHLQTAAKYRSEHIKSYLKENAEKFQLVTSRTKLKQLLRDYFLNPNIEDLNAINININDAISSIGNFENIYVLNKKGVVAISTDKSEIGKHMSGKDYFKNGQQKVGMYLEDDKGETKLFISGPFLLNDELLGVGITIISLDRLNEIMEENTGLGETGELYLVDSDKSLITISKLMKSRGSTIKTVETKGVNDCFEMKDDSGNEESEYFRVSRYDDYINHEVLGAHEYISRMDWCLMAEIDYSEIEKGFDEALSHKFFISFLLIVLISGIIAYFYSLSISRPILKLQEGVKRYSEGDLDYSIIVDSKDEFGQLAVAFNEMSTKLKKSYSVLEKKVAERTEELAVALSVMKDSRKATLNILEDVEEEKTKVARERDKINAILHSIGDAVLVMDDKYRIVMINKIVTEVSGFIEKELIGKKYFDILKFVSEKEGKEVRSFVDEAMKTGEIKKMARNTLLINKDGMKIPVADSSAPLKDKNGEIIGCVVVFRDVTVERQIDQAKTEFVSLASHQLRTPLSTIGWYAEMLLAEDAGKINEDQEQYLREIYKGNKRMVDLVNSLLNVSRLELGTFAVEPEMINLIDIANSVLNELKPTINKKRVKVFKKFDTNIPDKYLADQKLTRIIFQNLLSNAVKYNITGGKVSISLKKLKTEIRLTVSDTGLGIPDGQQALIFTKLFRADNVKETDTEGTGLGLYIIKSIVENTGGKIWFESPSKLVKNKKQKNRGTSFHISLPLGGMKKKEGTKKLS